MIFAEGIEVTVKEKTELSFFGASLVESLFIFRSWYPRNIERHKTEMNPKPIIIVNLLELFVVAIYIDAC